MFKNLISDGIENFFQSLAESCISMFLSLLTDINSVTVSVLEMPVVTSAILYSQVLAGSILAVKMSFEIWQHNILRINGDDDADLAGVILRTIQAGAMVVGTPWVTKEVYKWGTIIANDVALLPGTNLTDGGNMLSNLITSMMTSGGPLVIISLVVIFALVVFLLVLVQTFIRAAELAVVAVVGAFMALGLTNTSSQSFSTWWRELLNISLTQAIQMFMIKASFYSLLVTPSQDVPLLNMMIFAGFIWVTYKSPTILKNYVHSTGVGRGAGQAVQQASSMVIMRRLLTKTA